jgi:hypothetical protein
VALYLFEQNDFLLYVMIVDIDHYVIHPEMNLSFHQIYVHFVLVELHILIVDWQNIVEVLELMHYYFFDDELNEHLIISNQHIE